MKQLINWAIAILVFVLPLFFLPLTSEFYFFNKTILLYLATGVLLVLWGARIVREGRIRLRRSPLDFPILLLALVYLLAIVLVSPNKVEALMGRGGVVISLTVLYFVMSNNLGAANSSTAGETSEVSADLTSEVGEAVSLGDTDNRINSVTPNSVTPGVIVSLIASASLLALISIYQFIGVGAELLRVPNWMASRVWTPIGSPLALTTFLLPVLVLSLMKVFQRADFGGKILFSLAAALQAIALVLVGWLIWPGQEFGVNLLPYRAGWRIATAAFGESPFFGLGPENFLSAFTRFRPVFLNNLDSWTMRFGGSSNEYFHLLTTVGALGLGAYLFLLWRVIAHFSARSGREIRTLPSARTLFLATLEINFAITAPLITVFLIQLFLPANLPLLFLQFVLLGVLGGDNRMNSVTPDSATIPLSGNLAYLPLLFSIFYFLFSIYFSGRAWLADYYFRQSLLAAAENRGTDTYNLQIKTIQLNPYLDRYRRAYSQTNLALANSIAGKADVSDQDRQNIAQLVQQSIREAKTATVLNPDTVTNWENLANLYRNLINFATGADQWAIASSVRAVQLDPTNPLLRVDFGGLYYSLQDYDRAIRQFEIATELKPDFANGYYNLAAGWREKGETQKAVDNLEIVTNLVEVDSNDYQKAKAELEELKARLPAPAGLPGAAEEATPTARPEELQAPSPLPSPAIQPPLELPEELRPEVETTPTPEPTATPTP